MLRSSYYIRHLANKQLNYISGLSIFRTNSLINFSRILYVPILLSLSFWDAKSSRFLASCFCFVGCSCFEHSPSKFEFKSCYFRLTCHSFCCCCFCVCLFFNIYAKKKPKSNPKTTINLRRN